MLTELPDDVRRAIVTLFGVQVVCVLLAGVYTNHYLFLDPFGRGLPDVSPTAHQLVVSFQIGTALCALWSVALAVLASPAGGGRALDLLGRAIASDERSGWAWKAAVGCAALYAVGRLVLNEETTHATLQMLTDGTALLPFQYRDAVPALVRGLRAAVPGLDRVDLPWTYGAVEAVAGVGVWASVAHMLRPLVSSAAASRVGALAVFVPLAFNLVVPWRYNAIFFPYDTPSVAVFALGLGLLLRGDLRAYLVVFVLGTFNRETTCFLAVAYLALAVGREPWRRIAVLLAVQVALWVGIKVGMSWAYAGNDTLSDIGLFASMIGRSGRILTAVPGLVYLLVVPLGGLATLLWTLRHRVRPDRLRRMYWFIPPFVLGMIIVGELMEVRIYSEFVPIVTVGLVVALREVAAAGVRHAPPLQTMVCA